MLPTALCLVSAHTSKTSLVLPLLPTYLLQKQEHGWRSSDGTALCSDTSWLQASPAKAQHFPAQNNLTESEVAFRIFLISTNKSATSLCWMFVCFYNVILPAWAYSVLRGKNTYLVHLQTDVFSQRNLRQHVLLSFWSCPHCFPPKNRALDDFWHWVRNN